MTRCRHDPSGVFRPDHVLVLAARRLVPKNGTQYLMEAAAVFLGRFPQAVLVIAGDGPERDALEGTAQERGIAGRVRFLGNLLRAQLPAVIGMSDIAVLPSLKEATSIAGLEAMACAKPLVGTNVGGIPEIIEEGITGLLVPPASPTPLADAVSSLIADADLRHRMGGAARQRAVTEFAWPVIARRTAEVYEAALRHQSREREV